MGKPPPHIIFKKIVKSYFKKSLPQYAEEIVLAENQLFNCWDLHGVGSETCKQFEVLHEAAAEENEYFRRYVRNLNYPQRIMKHLAPAKHKIEYKGRHPIRLSEEPQQRFTLKEYSPEDFKF